MNDAMLKQSLENQKVIMHKAKHSKAEHKLDEIRQYLDIHLYSHISPHKLIVYYGLVDLIDELRELIKDDE